MWVDPGAQELAWRYDNKLIKQAKKHKRLQAWMIKQRDATIQEVFSQVSLEDSIKLLPWCISVAVPLCYVSGMMATTTQQDENVPAASESEGLLAPDPPSSLVHPPRTPSIYSTSLTGYDPGRYFPGGTPICWVPSHLHTEKGRLLSQPFIQQSSQQEDPCQLPRSQRKHSSAQGNEEMAELLLGTGTSFE